MNARNYYQDSRDIVPFNMVARVAISANEVRISVKLVNGDTLSLETEDARKFLDEYTHWLYEKEE